MAVPVWPGHTSAMVMLHGRGYSKKGFGQYFLPADEKEQERLDIMHTMIQAARPKPFRLHHAPFVCKRDPYTNEPARVLDLGHGTAIWLLDMAEKYPDADLKGMDIADMSPPGLLPNIDLRTQDYESPWALGQDCYDFIHICMGLGSVGNWPLLYAKAFRTLKPGGYFEHVELDFKPRCDDGTLPPNGRFIQWWNRYVAGLYSQVNRPLEYNEATGRLLADSGFINIQHEKFRVPTNGWSKDRAEHVSGRWWEYAMTSGEDRGHGFEALSLYPLTNEELMLRRVWPPDHVRRLVSEIEEETSSGNVHAYNVLHVWWAQKPVSATSQR